VVWKVESSNLNGAIIPMFALKENIGKKSKEINDIDI
jgi:hypothetical protein